ncbi:serine hydrolase domain-containing protein [Lederbergia lenta]|uniref:Penicillin binding protein n=1 Tax=Lederbergia lenta TaxID=1467 RepID=A0A2X4ZF97_LEDLE|nr:serine hydrolase domain-containing protein [Lederbergia lenta]MCM3112189.1 beta-lactamase family protein [Lederbergia lenta]MEC2323356.1 serine hydrolase [Lederbergia lenta]SQI63275.1 penicillin binding protein [Lederbergia lenta]
METEVYRFLANEIDQGNIPGASIYISHQGMKVMKKSIGYRALTPKKLSIEGDTIFDIASLTKIVSTLTACLQLIDKGEIRLDDKIAYFIPAFAANGKTEITIKHLLTHTSGLPAHRPFYKEALKVAEVVDRICAERLVSPVGDRVIYSDLGFILLSTVIEKVTDQSFNEYVSAKILNPLDMQDTGFNPSFNQERFAATEYSEKLNNYKYGIVHDENAEAMGGISGHAGIFSTIQDLAKFTSMIENDGVYKGKRIISKAALALSKRNFTSFDQEARGLGWQIKSAGASSSGDLFSSQSYGHTGFTGTSIWFDPKIQLHVILLTNRVHAPNKDAILRLRPRLHNLIRSYF